MYVVRFFGIDYLVPIYLHTYYKLIYFEYFLVFDESHQNSWLHLDLETVFFFENFGNFFYNIFYF